MAATPRVDPIPVPPERIEVRPLRSDAELRACVRLQKLTWGEDFDESVPPSILQVCQRIGGVAAGAFAGEDRLLGFVFGISGVREGRLVHWSDMLAVHAAARGLGLGRRLKEYQRDTVRALGVETIYWSYDPLVARNAHLNLERLGAVVEEYVEQMYGESASDLHRGIGTDRFVVAWDLSGKRPAPPRPSAEAAALAPTTGEVPPGAVPPLVRVEVPADIHAVLEESPTEAARWRRATRAGLTEWMGLGYRVAGFHRDPVSGGGSYLLVRD